MGLKLFLVVMGWWLIHPIHVSVTDVEYDEDRKALEFTSRIFLDDIELHIRYNRNQPYLDITAPKNELTSDQLVKDYVMPLLEVQVNGKTKEIDYVGHEIDGDAVNVYYQVLNVRKFRSITMKNNILLDFYTDQVNMVHVKFEGELRSMRMTPDEPVSTLKFME